MQPSENIYEHGQVLLIDKPFQWTSFDVVRKIRSLIRIKKVGHAGTLDPLATGLLIVCTGRFTKRINEFMSQEKEYTGTIRLGAVTPTYDLESSPVDPKPYSHITSGQVENAVRQLTGDIMQAPPAHSAIKVQGRRVYELARAGKEVIMEKRPVTIGEFEISAINLPDLDFRIVCSTGTYIRSIAHDLGQLLGCGGHLVKLCRTRIGEQRLEHAIGMEEFTARFTV